MLVNRVKAVAGVAELAAAAAVAVKFNIKIDLG
jgi:hypothetical protein